MNTPSLVRTPSKQKQRRWLVSLALSVLAFPSYAWPDKPVSIVIPFSAGGAADSAMRLLAPKLGEILGQAVVVENKPGAGAVIGTQYVVRSKNDGHTLLMGSAGNTITSSLARNLTYDFEKDLMPITLVANVPGVVVVPASSPAKDVRGLIALLKAEPGRRVYGSPGLGTSVHMAGELFQQMSGTKMLHVPYRGAGNAMTDLLGGRLDLMFPALAAAQPYMKTNEIRALAVTGKSRSALVPNLPTVAEAGIPNYEVGAWIGLLAPTGTPQPVIEKIRSAVIKALADPAVESGLIGLGVEPVRGSQEEFQRLVRSETARWSKLIKQANIQSTP